MKIVHELTESELTVLLSEYYASKGKIVKKIVYTVSAHDSDRREMSYTYRFSGIKIEFEE